MSFYTKPLLVSLLILLSACLGTTITQDDVTGPKHWGASENVTQLKHLYFSDQPDIEALKTAKAHGVTTVINLRHPSEHDWDEQQAAKMLGLKYINTPIATQSKSFDTASINKITAAVKAQKGQPVLMHCSSGNRAAAWLAIHLVQDHQLPEADAIDIAQKTGLTNSVLVERVHTYLSTH